MPFFGYSCFSLAPGTVSEEAQPRGLEGIAVGCGGRQTRGPWGQTQSLGAGASRPKPLGARGSGSVSPEHSTRPSDSPHGIQAMEHGGGKTHRERRRERLQQSRRCYLITRKEHPGAHLKRQRRDRWAVLREKKSLLTVFNKPKIG